MLRNNCSVCLGLIYKKEKRDRKKNLFSLTINKPDVLFRFFKKVHAHFKVKTCLEIIYIGHNPAG